MVLDIIEYSFSLIRKKPKVLLPQVIGWITTVMMLGIIVMAFSEVPAGGLTQAGALEFYTVIATKYLLPLLAVIVLSVIVGTFIAGTYPDIVRQAFSSKDVSLKIAFNASKKRFASLLWTGFLTMLLVIIAYIGLVLTIFIPYVGVFVFLAAMLVLLVVAVPALYMINTVVVLENLSGIPAIRRSYELAKGRFMSIWGLLILMIIFAIGIGFLQYIPVIGVVLILPINAFVSSWGMMAPVVFYFMRIKKKKHVLK